MHAGDSELRSHECISYQIWLESLCRGSFVGPHGLSQLQQIGGLCALEAKELRDVHVGLVCSLIEQCLAEAAGRQVCITMHDFERSSIHN